MLIEIERRDDVCILHLSGRFATGLEPEILRSKADEIKSQNCKKVLIDLSGVSAIGSTGIGFMVGIYTSMLNAGGRFVLTGANRRVCEVLDLTHLSTVLPSAADIASGFAALRAESRAAP